MPELDKPGLYKRNTQQLTCLMISVCIPTYNQGLYVEDCIQSVLQQRLQPGEIIVSNDCSTDDTQEILNRLAIVYPVLKIVHQPRNIGITANVNSCFRLAKGNYIVRVDSDDMLCPDYLYTLSSLLDQYTEAGYAHCAIQEISHTGKPLCVRKLYRTAIYENSEHALTNALKGYKVAANVIMFRRSALEAADCIRSKYNFAEDYFLATDIAAHGFGNVYSPEILANYRVWTDSGYIRVKRKLEEIQGLTSVFSDVIEPAFTAKAFDLKKTKKARQRFAVAQADCLCWKIYNQEEKDVLKTALMVLSNSNVARFYFYIYEHHLEALPVFFKKLKHTIKQTVKNIISRPAANHS